MVHAIKNRRYGKEDHMALKLDISKAYDRVEWTFLEATMRKLGFREAWINLALNCITSISYEILVNGYPGKSFKP